MDTTTGRPAPVWGGRPERGLRLLGAALVLGVAGNLLLRSHLWGVNVPLWFAALVGLYLFGRFGERVAWGRGVPALLATAVLFAGALAWRDSELLGLANLSAAVVCLVCSTLRSRRGGFWIGGLSDIAGAGWRAGGRLLQGLWLPLALGIPWQAWWRGRDQTLLRQTLRGSGLAIGLLLVFGTLLAGADPIFGRLVQVWDPTEAITSILVVAAAAWFGGSLLWHMASPLPAGQDGETAAPWRWGRISAWEAVAALTLVNLLFLVFIAVQVRYLFGGAQVVLESPFHISFAEYARRGFFELVAVAALVLVVLLWAEGAAQRTTRTQRVALWVASGTQVVLTQVIAGSAVQRMRIYQEAMGLSELRVYTMAFMVWTVVLLLWFCATVLRQRRDWFAMGAFVSGLATIALLNAINPDALIARANIGRPRFDVRYHTRLSGDAVPELIRGLDQLAPGDRASVAAALLKRWTRADRDWRSWNLGRAEAEAAVAGRLAELNAVAKR